MPIGTIVQTWKQFVDARQAYTRLEGVLISNPERTATHEGEQVHGQISLRQLCPRQNPQHLPRTLGGSNPPYQGRSLISQSPLRCRRPPSLRKRLSLRCSLGNLVSNNLNKVNT